MIKRINFRTHTYFHLHNIRAQRNVNNPALHSPPTNKNHTIIDSLTQTNLINNKPSKRQNLKKKKKDLKYTILKSSRPNNQLTAHWAKKFVVLKNSHLGHPFSLFFKKSVIEIMIILVNEPVKRGSNRDFCDDWCPNWISKLANSNSPRAYIPSRKLLMDYIQLLFNMPINLYYCLRWLRR